jgi:hypothetical protein
LSVMQGSRLCSTHSPKTEDSRRFCGAGFLASVNQAFPHSIARAGVEQCNLRLSLALPSKLNTEYGDQHEDLY